MSPEVELFGRPAAWRAEIIVQFRLRGDERCAAASPSPGFPQLLDSMMAAIHEAPRGRWLDIGGGLGGVASWINRTHGQDIIVVDPSLDSLEAGRRLFPALPRAGATAQHLPFRSGSIAIAVISGTLSLQTELNGFVAEVARVLVEGGFALFTDLWSQTKNTVRAAPNTFWSIEDLRRTAQRHDLDGTHYAVADVSTGWWSTAAVQINNEIRAKYSRCDGYEMWRRDHDHLQCVLSSGSVLAAGVVMKKSVFPQTG